MGELIIISSSHHPNHPNHPSASPMELLRAIVVLAIIRLACSAPHDPNISPEAAQDLVRERPWLANLEGCLVWNPECVRFGEDKAGYMLDEADDAATNETRCLHRASEYHAWCGNDFTNRTAAVFLQTGAMEVFPPFGCALYQRGCPAVSTRELEVRSGARLQSNYPV